MWNNARKDFVEAISNLALKSQTQVGSNTRKTFAEVHNYVRDFVDNHALELLHKNYREVTRNISPKKEAPKHEEHHHQEEEHYPEEETKGEEGTHEGETHEHAEGEEPKGDDNAVSG